MILKGTFTRPNTDVEFYDGSAVNKPILDDLMAKGIIIDRGNYLSEDLLTRTHYMTSQIETASDINIVTSSLRTDPNFYEMHIAFQEYCDANGITRGPIVIEIYSSDWILLGQMNFMVADLF